MHEQTENKKEREKVETVLSEAHKSRLLTKYGIDPDNPVVRDMVSAGLLRSVDREEAARLLARDPEELESGGIYLEYPGTRGSVFTIRFDVPPRGPDGKEKKYLRPPGQRNALFVPPGLDLNAAEEIWLTEGELKALCAWTRGLPVVAVAGVACWRTRTRDPLAEAVLSDKEARLADVPDEAALIPELNRPWTGKRWVLWYDSDITREHQAWPFFGRLAEQLYRLGAAEVKVLNVPGVGSGKTGLDDYILAREREGGDPATELRALASSARAWLPTAAGARPHAEALLAEVRERLAAGDRAAWASDEAKRALACLLAADPAAAEAAKEELARNREQKRALTVAAAQLLKEAREEQSPEPRQKAAVPAEATFADAFPPAVTTPFADWPVPPGFLVTEDGRVWEIKVALGPKGEPVERHIPVSAAPIVPAKVLVPVGGPEDAAAGVEYEIWWWWPAEERWRRTTVSAAVLNSNRAAEVLAARDVPVGLDNRRAVTAWFGALRDLRLLYPERVRLKEQAVISRTGWVTLPSGAEAFALGFEILHAGGREEAAVDAVVDDADPAEDPLVEWTEALGANEREMLRAMGIAGTLEGQLETYLRWFEKHPLTAFVTGAAAAGPILSVLRSAGEIEVAGFLVQIFGEAGTGKTTLNAFGAGVWGKPTVGEGGMIRTAHRTVVHSEILFSMHNDLSTHIDESQQERVSEVVAGIIYTLGLGQGKERASRSGGGRRTRYFNTVCVLSTEQSVLHMVAREGVHHRVIPLPPLFPERSEEYRREADRARKELQENYGHLGRRLVQHLLQLPPEERKELVLGVYRGWKEAFEEGTDMALPPSDPGMVERNQVAKRLATRAAACLAGLDLLLRACGVPDDVREEVAWRAADAAWDHVLENVVVKPLLARIVDTLRSYIFENRERIEGMRSGADDRPPSTWLGRLFTEGGKTYIALFPRPLYRLFQESAGVPYETAVFHLRRAGLVADASSLRVGSEVHWMLVLDYEALLGFGAPTGAGEQEDRGEGDLEGAGDEVSSL